MSLETLDLDKITTLEGALLVIRELVREVVLLRAENVQLRAENVELRSENSKLKERIAKLDKNSSN
jgi:cell division protein FtsB